MFDDYVMSTTVFASYGLCVLDRKVKKGDPFHGMLYDSGLLVNDLVRTSVAEIHP
jgi:hypothetical protein